MAAWSLWHGFFLGPSGVAGDLSPLSFLLAGNRWPQRFQRAGTRKTQTCSRCAWLGRGGDREPFQSRGVGDFSKISAENRHRDGDNAYTTVDGATSRIFAAGSLPVDESAGAGAARTARMFFRPQLR